MRYGRKSSSQRIDGYKAHIIEDVDSELITEVAVTSGSAHDSEPLEDMTDCHTHDTLIDPVFSDSPKKGILI